MSRTSCRRLFVNSVSIRSRGEKMSSRVLDQFLLLLNNDDQFNNTKSTLETFLHCVDSEKVEMCWHVL